MDCKGHIIVADYNHRVQVLTKDDVPILEVANGTSKNVGLEKSRKRF